jgi:hypothetical protein
MDVLRPWQWRSWSDTGPIEGVKCREAHQALIHPPSKVKRPPLWPPERRHRPWRKGSVHGDEPLRLTDRFFELRIMQAQWSSID